MSESEPTLRGFKWEGTRPTRVRLILWSRSSEDRFESDDFEDRGLAESFAMRIAKFLRPGSILTIEETSQTTYRLED